MRAFPRYFKAISCSRCDNTKSLVVALEEKRAAEGLSRNGMAQKLGISHTMYDFILLGRCQVGPKCIVAIRSSYPDLAPAIISYLFPAIQGEGQCKQVP